MEKHSTPYGIHYSVTLFMIYLGLLIIAIGAFCQSSSYVPIKKIKDWSWESFWLVQAVFAYFLLPLGGAFLAMPEGESLFTLFQSTPSFNFWMTILFGMLWGVGGLTFGLSMRYLGVALGQSIALGTTAGIGTVMGPILLQVFFPESDALSQLTMSVILGVIVTLVGINIIGVAGAMKANNLSDDQKSSSSKEFNFGKGILIALLCGFMSGCFNVGLAFGVEIYAQGTSPLFQSLPATFLVTMGGFLTNAVYCIYQNSKNHTFDDYKKGNVWLNNLCFCILAGALWYSQFFGLSLGKGFLIDSPTLMTLSFCILMSLNVIFSNIWGIILKEWKGCTQKTIVVLVVGIIVLIISTFLPQLI